MQINHIDFKDTGLFPKIILDYLQQKDSIQPFYKYAPEIDAFSSIINEKSKETINRKVLVEVLKKQYETVTDKAKTLENIEALLNEKTFTVTTGHQLNIFTGPLYFIYKIITAINLAQMIEERNPGYKIIPVYWMATEDHDFAEINNINLFNKKIEWNAETKGATGKIKTESIQPVIEELKTILGESEHSKELVKLFEEAYLNNKDLSSATVHLVHELFKEYGLVIIDADHKELKKEFASIMKDDITNQHSYKIITEANQSLSANYNIQVNPREINFFYLLDQYRERIVFENNQYATVDSKFSFSKEVLLSEIENHPERFSPNVVMRPVYEEKILPNLAYIGGPGELAYWLQLKNNFDHYKLNFPMLVLRNCLLVIDEVSAKRMEKFNLNYRNIFEPVEKLTKDFIASQAAEELDLKQEVEQIMSVYQSITEKSLKIDASLKSVIEAEKTKLLNSLNSIEQRLIKAEKKKFETEIGQLQKLKEKLFPGHSLQERYENFSAYYMKSGMSFIHDLKNNTSALNKQFIIAS